MFHSTYFTQYQEGIRKKFCMRRTRKHGIRRERAEKRWRKIFCFSKLLLFCNFHFYISRCFFYLNHLKLQLAMFFVLSFITFCRGFKSWMIKNTFHSHKYLQQLDMRSNDLAIKTWHKFTQFRLETQDSMVKMGKRRVGKIKLLKKKLKLLLSQIAFYEPPETQ